MWYYGLLILEPHFGKCCKQVKREWAKKSHSCANIVANVGSKLRESGLRNSGQKICWFRLEKEWVQRTAWKHGMPMLLPEPKMFSFPAHECTFWQPFLNYLQSVLRPRKYNFSIPSPPIRLLGNQVGEKEGCEGGHGRVSHSVWECAGTWQADGQWHHATPRWEGFLGV